MTCTAALEIWQCPWSQISDTQSALLRAKAEEEAAKTREAGEARRWTGVRTIVEARSLLKTLFRTAAAQKAAVSTHLQPALGLNSIQKLCLGKSPGRAPIMALWGCI